MNEDQKIALIILIVYVLIQLIPQFLPDSAVKTFLVTPQVVGYSSLFACVALFIRKKSGEKFITIDQIASNGFNWFTLLMLVGLGPCCDAMTSDLTGILPWLTSLVQPVCERLSPFGVLVFLCVFCIIATNFIDNIAVIFVIIPVIYIVCVAVNANPAAMLTAVIPCIQMGIMVPGATPHVALVFGKESTGYVSFGKLAGWSLVRSAFTCIISIVIGWAMMGIFPAV
jgi:di/tricarboxylate transporter